MDAQSDFAEAAFAQFFAYLVVVAEFAVGAFGEGLGIYG